MKKEINKLPKKFKAKWLKALRSGKYKQGNGNLKTGKGKNARYCCLGVACDIVGAKSITDKGFIRTGSDIRGITKVPKLLIGSDYGYEDDYNPIVEKLATMNDLTGSSFKEIANYIEKHL